MRIWSIWIVLGLITFLTRLSFIAIFDKVEPPRNLRRALRFVPIAVLSAIIAPEILLRGGSLVTDPLDPKLLAGVLASVTAYITKNTLLTILVGMGVLLGFPVLRSTFGF